MDNDILINQARQLYATLLARQITAAKNPERIDRLIICAYCRYLRRLNRCAICHQQRNHDCNREPGEKHIPCAPRSQFKHTLGVELVI